MAGSGGGEAICMARTEEGFRKGGRSLRGVYLGSTVFAGGTGFDATEISDGSEEMKLVVVIPEARRDDDRIDGREV